MLCYSFCAGFFAQIFYSANQELFEKIKSLDLPNNYFYENDSKDFKKGLKLLSEFDEFKEITVDFTRLFIADYQTLKAPPFASYYYSTNLPEIFTKNSVMVSKIYKENGFNSYFIELPADAVVNEFLFLEFAFKNENLELVKSFLQDEILPYIYKFIDKVINNANTNYYKAFGYLLKDYFELLKSEYRLKAAKRYTNSV